MPADRRSSHPRQTPVSCASCRKKKLKCDRVQPCFNCRSRGIECWLQGRVSVSGSGNGSAGVSASGVGSGVVGGGGHAPYPTSWRPAEVTPVDADDGLKAENEAIKARLRRLEEIVLGGGVKAASSAATAVSTTAASAMRIEGLITPSATDQSSPENENAKDSQWLEGVGTRENSRIPFLSNGIKVKAATMERIATESVPAAQVDGVVYLPLYERSKELFVSYVKHVDTLQHIIYTPHINAIIDGLYAKLDGGKAVELSHLALLLSILASITAHWSTRATELELLFESSDTAVSVTLYWLKSALDVLERSRRTESPTLETVQATIVLLFLIYHMESFSPKSRSLHMSGLAAARDIGLHMTDLARDRKRELTREQIIETEMRRRVWWHLCATDWSMSLTGGPVEGTYLVNPKHMRTLKPRNITDEDLATQGPDFSRPLSEATPMSYYLHRIRLGELCRDVADLTWEMVAGANPDQIPYESVIALDERFDGLLAGLPENLRIENPEEQQQIAEGEGFTALRYFTNLTIEARHCKLHLPFLLRVPGNERYNYSRDICLRAARKMLGLRHARLTEKVASIKTKIGLNIILHHFFCAIVVLVMDLCVNRETGDEKERIEEIRSSCTILEAAKEQSSAAGLFLDSLLAVLRKHKVRFQHQESTATDVQMAGQEKMSQPAQDNEYPVLQDFALNDIWQDYLNFDATVEPQDWDALFSDLNSAAIG